MELAELKRAAREAAKLRRDTAHAELHRTAPAAVARNFIDAIRLSPGTAISGFWPSRNEIDVRPLMERLYRDGHSVGLPVVLGKGRPLQFRHWHPGDRLEPRPFGLMEPADNALEMVPIVLLVPFLAVDAEGYRLGYGAGYYDLTLARLRLDGPVLAVGVGYSVQRVDDLPRDTHDEPLDWLVTEAGAAAFER